MVISITEAAHQFGVKPDTLYRFVKAHVDLPGIQRIGGNARKAVVLLIDPDALVSVPAFADWLAGTGKGRPRQP